MKQRIQTVFLAFSLVFLSACAGPNAMFQADTFDKKVVVTYVGIEAVADSANIAVTAGKMTSKDVTNFVAICRTALAGLDVASQLHRTDPAAAERHARTKSAGTKSGRRS